MNYQHEVDVAQYPPVALGIAGGSGSGKSTLVDRLLQSSIGAHISVLKHDDYYRNHIDMPEEIRDSNNWDHPDSIENELFAQHLQQLKNGIAIDSPLYDFSTHSRKSSTKRIEANPILIVEGILIFAIESICEQLDYRIYLEATPDERILRRLLRDTKDRGRSLESVISQYRTTTRIMHDEWIEPSRNQAHLIIPTQNEKNLVQSSHLLELFLRQQMPLYQR